jgi:hypothetical protein
MSIDDAQLTAVRDVLLRLLNNYFRYAKYPGRELDLGDEARLQEFHDKCLIEVFRVLAVVVPGHPPWEKDPVCLMRYRQPRREVRWVVGRLRRARIPVAAFPNLYERLLNDRPHFRAGQTQPAIDLVPDSGRRKATGSFYTPSRLVRYAV